ncbi:hypothetical protein L596_023641 [Steinernema carpocapsae]|uniref:Uncharacterized protein n=1 Tax=Steinernema carpocapsae TaxID=34508 RepID=A0A4U5MF10_STECR|nr:hypothetical protein L596_023641 [Steinernema carpocapsae]
MDRSKRGEHARTQTHKEAASGGANEKVETVVERQIGGELSSSNSPPVESGAERPKRQALEAIGAAGNGLLPAAEEGKQESRTVQRLQA